MSIAPGADIGDDLLARRLAPLDRGRAEVRQQHDIVERQQRRVDRGFVRIDVEPGARDAARLQRRDQRLFVDDFAARRVDQLRSAEHTSELQSLMRTSYAAFCLKKKHTNDTANSTTHNQKSPPNNLLTHL